MIPRRLRHPFLVTVAVLTLLIGSMVSTMQSTVAYAAASGRSSAQVPYDANTSCPTNSGYSTCDGYDVQGSYCGFIDGSYGAYNVGMYPGDYSWLQIWWAPHCHSNFIYVYVPSNNTYCGGYACDSVLAVEFYRTSPSYSGTWCNTGSNSMYYCNPAANYPCTNPGACNHNGTSIYYCAYQWDTCRLHNNTFHGEWIGQTRFWSSFVTDMLYAQNQAVQACVILGREYTSPYAGLYTHWICSQWH